MPRGLAAGVREACAVTDMSDCVPQESAKSKTGYANIIEVKGKFQARLQVKGDGRGGTRKRKQYALPGLFDTALEAAIFLAYVKEHLSTFCDEDGIPFKQLAERKERCGKAAPVQPVEAAQSTAVPAYAMATPIPCGMLPLPITAASPLPMAPLGYSPPFPQRI
jgi:hypothetical protein